MAIKQDAASLARQWQEMSRYEEALRKRGLRFIAGLDEAGRGPLAGPVTAAAVILPDDAYIPGLNDSKKLSEKRRLQMEVEIKKQAIAWSCVSVEHGVIDEINILEASKLAMCRAVEQLSPGPEHLLIDALTLPLPLAQTGIIQGDAKSVSIAAASILAKSERDRIMLRYDALYPEYGFAKHKGYPTIAHKAVLRELGYSPIHRRSFKY